MYEQPRPPETRTSRRNSIFCADSVFFFFPFGWVPSDVNIDRSASVRPNTSLCHKWKGLVRSTCSQKRVQWNKLWYYPERHEVSWLSFWPGLYLDRSGTIRWYVYGTTSAVFFGVQTFKLCLVRYELVWRTMINYIDNLSRRLTKHHPLPLWLGPCVHSKSYLLFCKCQTLLLA